LAIPEFYFQVLGANSALPTRDRFPSSFILAYKQSRILIDCGEGSQIKMAEYKIKRSKIDHIFISHMHGDHVFGLPGFLNSLTLSGRKKAIYLYGPTALKTYIDAVIAATGGHLGYELCYHLLDTDEVTDLGMVCGLQVKAVPLQHRIPTYGYSFTEVMSEYNIDPLKIKAHNLPRSEILLAKSGQDIERENDTIAYQDVTLPPREMRSMAYCSDTVYDPSIVPAIKGSTLLYHEATYLEELRDKARERMHSTTTEAATIAEMAKVDTLVIGHYSSRYVDVNPLLKEAQKVFDNTMLAVGGKKYEIR